MTIVEGTHRWKAPLLGRPLSPRQIECLKERFRRGSRKDAAASMGITETTMRWHLTDAGERLGTTNAYEAAYVLWLRDLWGDDSHLVHEGQYRERDAHDGDHQQDDVAHPPEDVARALALRL
jgi:DNA-binding CsgD family transcriptional regulator